MARIRTLAGPNRNGDPPLKSKAVDVSSVDFTPPNGELITGINCSVAGTVYLLSADDGTTTLIEYMNTGWNPCTASLKVLHNGSATATVLAAKLVSN